MFEITILRNSKTNLGFVYIKLLNVTKAALWKQIEWYHYFFGVIFAFIIQGFGIIPLMIVRKFMDLDKHISLSRNPGIDNNVFFILIVIKMI